MIEYPLMECRDCINNDDCSLIDKLNTFLEENSFVDISGSACEDYATEHTVDNNWMAYTGNSSPFIEEVEDYLDEDEPLPTVEEMFATLDEAISGMTKKGFTTVGAAMSYDTMQLFLEDSVKGSHIKHLVSREHGRIEVEESNRIVFGYFALALRLDDEDVDGEEDV